MTIKDWENLLCGYPMEFDWFGIDDEGNLAVFSSINYGPIPSLVTKSFHEYLQVRDFIQELPVSSAALVLTKQPGDFTDWINYARKGLFSYDIQDVHREHKLNIYDLIAVPTIPVKAVHLPSTLLKSIPVLSGKFGVDLSFETILN